MAKDLRRSSREDIPMAQKRVRRQPRESSGAADPKPGELPPHTHEGGHRQGLFRYACSRTGVDQKGEQLEPSCMLAWMSNGAAAVENVCSSPKCETESYHGSQQFQSWGCIRKRMESVSTQSLVRKRSQQHCFIVTPAPIN